MVPDDIKELAVPILSHRLPLDAEAEFSGVVVEEVISQLLAQVRRLRSVLLSHGRRQPLATAAWKTVTPVGRLTFVLAVAAWLLGLRLDGGCPWPPPAARSR